MKTQTYIILFLAAFCCCADKPIKIKFVSKQHIKVSEPSDMCYAPDGKSLFIVSDNGKLFQCDTLGNIIKKAKYDGIDYEGVYADERFVYAVDESPRRIALYDLNTLEMLREVNVPYSGARNSGYESITFNKAKDCFIIITEKHPIIIMELDKDLRVKSEIRFKGSSDISSATYYNEKLYLLGDEDAKLMRLNPNTYEVEKIWRFPILNPESVCFDANGNLKIASDDRQTIYSFKPLEN